MRTPSVQADPLPRRLPAPAWALLLAALMALQGCGTRPAPGKSGAPGTSGTSLATAPGIAPNSVPGPQGSATPALPEPATSVPRTPALVVERQWLQSWFNGTPVRIAQQGSGPVAIDVPQSFCFDSGRSSVKPPLAAVLDKLALSLRRTPAARLPLLAAPADRPDTGPAPGTSPAADTLALQRAAQMRSHLLSRGVPAVQLGAPTASKVAAAQLRLELAAP